MQAASSVGGQTQLSDEDLALIEAFLARRSELSGNVRARMASGILERLQAKSQVQVDGGLTAESALETLAQGLRSRNSYLVTRSLVVYTCPGCAASPDC